VSNLDTIALAHWRGFDLACTRKLQRSSSVDGDAERGNSPVEHHAQALWLRANYTGELRAAWASWGWGIAGDVVEAGREADDGWHATAWLGWYSVNPQRDSEDRGQAQMGTSWSHLLGFWCSAARVYARIVVFVLRGK